MDDETYEYPYGDLQLHEALADLDRRLKALEPKPVDEKPAFDQDEAGDEAVESQAATAAYPTQTGALS
jgi:hypothetical protein